jgi:MFS family permease
MNVEKNNKSDVNIYVKEKLRPFIAIGIFISMLAQNFISTAFGTALPAMIVDLGITRYNFIGMLFMIGILVSAIFTPMAANLSKKIGRKKLFLTGAYINLIAIALMYFAKSLFPMIGFRALQGLGGAFVFATGLSLIGDVFPSEERAKWLSGYGVITSIGSLGGPVLAGLLVDYFNWRYIFIVGIAIGIVGILMVVRSLPKDEYDETAVAKFDYPGSILLGLSFILILGVCITGGTFFQWASTTTAVLVFAGLALLLMFVKVERKSEVPMFPMTMFKYNAFTISFVAVMINTMGAMAVTTYLPTFIQAVMLKSATSAGSLMAALALVSLVTGPLVGQISARTGKYKIFTIFSTVIMIGIPFMLAGLTAETQIYLPWIAVIVLGASLGVTQFIFTAIVQNGVKSEDIALATGGIQLGVTVGAMLGIAFTGIMMTQMPDLAVSLPFMFRFSGGISVITLIAVFMLKENTKKIEE